MKHLIRCLEIILGFTFYNANIEFPYTLHPTDKCNSRPRPADGETPARCACPRYIWRLGGCIPPGALLASGPTPVANPFCRWRCDPAMASQQQPTTRVHCPVLGLPSLALPPVRADSMVPGGLPRAFYSARDGCNAMEGPRIPSSGAFSLFAFPIQGRVRMRAPPGCTGQGDSSRFR